MDAFTKAIAAVEKKCLALLKARRYKIGTLPNKLPVKGVYLFSQDGKALYVGRTNNMYKRLQYHTRNNHNQATFAFLLARRKTGKKKATYQKAGSRSDLLTQPRFLNAFNKARDAIRKMDVQFIAEANANRQALLEICAAMRTKAKCNDFDNH
jgi:predicted GIY-YIG superfamily endonuclease